MKKTKLKPGLSGLSPKLRLTALKTVAKEAFEIGKATRDSYMLQKSSRLLKEAMDLQKLLLQTAPTCKYVRGNDGRLYLVAC